MRTVHLLQMMEFITVRVRSALGGEVQTLRVDIVKVEPTKEFPSVNAFQVEFTGCATPQEVLDCVSSAGDIGYKVMSRQWKERIGKR